jgi:hypothetical protein
MSVAAVVFIGAIAMLHHLRPEYGGHVMLAREHYFQPKMVRVT